MNSKQNPSRFDRHPWLTGISISLLMLVILLGASEIVARFIFPQWAPATAERVNLWHYDSLLGWAHRPGQTTTFVHQDFSAEVNINSVGLRDREYTAERSDKKRMLVLGDSFGWGFGVETDEVFSEVLERRYPDWEIINASVSGYSTDQEYLYLRERGMRYAPDVVVVLFYQNDLVGNARDEIYWHNKPYFRLDNYTLTQFNIPVPPATLGQRLDRFFYGKTYLLAKLYRMVELVRQGGTLKSEASWSVNTDLTFRLLKAMNRLSRQHDAKLVVVSIPMGKGLRSHLKAFCLRNNIRYLSLDEAFESAQTPYTFAHNEHWNSTGHVIAADAVEQYLEAEGIF